MPVKGFKYKRGQFFTQFNLTHVCTRRPDRTVTPRAILFFSKYEPLVIQIPMNDLNLLLLLCHLILCIFFPPSHVFPIRGPVCITSITDPIPFMAYKTFSKTEQYFAVKPLLNHVRGGKTQRRHEYSSIWTGYFFFPLSCFSL